MADDPPPIEPMNPFESAKRHDLTVPQTANPAVEVYPVRFACSVASTGSWA